MTWVTFTRFFVVFITIVVILYDIAAAYFGGKPATVSWVIRDWCRNEPIIALLAGVVVGHILWNT